MRSLDRDLQAYVKAIPKLPADNAKGLISTYLTYSQSPIAYTSYHGAILVTVIDTMIHEFSQL